MILLAAFHKNSEFNIVKYLPNKHMQRLTVCGLRNLLNWKIVIDDIRVD